ncbi:MAG: hypothetical protein EOO67_17140 [Microbacterium sp.]|nr:MAG: hypothetical protein EOO67_17140 [Microbacterium sp.]
MPNVIANPVSGARRARRISTGFGKATLCIGCDGVWGGGGGSRLMGDNLGETPDAWQPFVLTGRARVA